MARFGTVAQQYFDASGKPLGGGKLYFYEPGTTTTKTVYSDADETTSIAQPVVLDSSGYQPDVFFSGQAKVVLDDADDVQIDVTDPVGIKPPEQFPLWSDATSYSEGALVQGSDNLLYMSLGDSNLGNDPTSTSGFWLTLSAVTDYSASYTYNDGSVVYYDNALYRCNSDSTVSVTPSQAATEWDMLGMPTAGGTFTGDVVFEGGVTLTESTETHYTIEDGASVEIDPANGFQQTWTLGDDRTATSALSSGQAVLLRVADGDSAYTLTITGATWVGGLAPTLPATGYALFLLFQVDTELYANYIGDVS